MYELDTLNKNGKESKYFVASRAEDIPELKLVTKENKADGVSVFSVYRKEGEQEKVVLIRQYRCPIDDYVYEFPAGLVDKGENFKTTGKRELLEETGLQLHVLDVDEMYMKPFFTTVGMTDESCRMIFGYADGNPSDTMQEESEEIEIVLATREEAKRILREEKVAMMCAYMLIHFIQSKEGHTFDFLKS